VNDEPHLHPESLGGLLLALALATVLVGALWILHSASNLKGLTMNTTFGAILASAVRHGLTLAGGYLVGKGILTDAQSVEFVGIGMAGAAYAWSLVQKHSTGKKLAEALGK
jgi:hypothetical protein